MKSPEYYLESGPRTHVTENIRRLAETINGKSSKDIIRQIIYIMNKNVPKKADKKSKEKFHRSADEILKSGNRNGCCDSCTLFVALCRAKGIPAFQIVAINVDALKYGNFTKGHFFAGCYLKETGKWAWIDSDFPDNDTSKLKFDDFDSNSKYINGHFYIFGIVRDYSEFELDGIKIDSIPHMIEIHHKVYEKYLKGCIENP